MTCPDCGKSYSDTAAACLNCGYNTRTLETPKDNIGNLDAFLLYVLSFLIPLAGFIIGAIYVSKNEADYKDVGQGCLLLALINIILGFIILLVVFS
jgi:hypothetical protein